MERLALIEVLDHDGRVQHAVPVTHWPVTVGRALDCDVVLHDPYVAPRHATVDKAADGAPGLVLTVGDSVNGVRLAQRRLSSGTSALLPEGVEFHAGRSGLRVRLAGESLAAERPLGHQARRLRVWVTVGAAAALLFWTAASLWLQNLPGSGWDKYLPILLGTTFGVAIWSALWGLGSKLFQGHFRFTPHLRVVLGFILARLSLDLLLALAAFALSWPLLSHISGWLEIALFAALLATHVSVLLPARRQTVGLTFGALCLLAVGITGALSWRHHQRLFDELYAATLPPPALRLVQAKPVSALLDDVRPLRTRLDRQAKEDEENDSAAER